MLPRDVYLQPHAPDPVLDEQTVLALVRRHVPSATRVTGVDESGRKGRAYFIDDDVVLKTHRPDRLRARRVEEFETSLEKEAFFLQQMSADARLCTPKPLGYRKELGVEYVCMTRVPGVSLRRADLSPSQRAAALRELGRMLRLIHGLPQAPFGESGLFPRDGSAVELKSKLEALFSQLVEAISELSEEWRIRVSAETIAARALGALPETVNRVALHSNPAGEHVFVNPQSGALVGLIDFGDAYIGHPAFDLRPWRAPADRSALLAGYTEEGAVDESFLRIWRIGLILGELAAVLRHREPPSRSEETLSLLLEEL